MKLQFEPSASGQLEGINDAGIETFAGDHLGSLAREQGQNSMDAREDGAKYVDICYELMSVPKADLPGAKELKSTLEKIKDFWSGEREDKKTHKIVDRALRLLEKKEVPVLRISDRNTTGLRGSDKDMVGDWFSLTKSTGVSLKGEGKLGSFGIGKNVFWANSRLRLVYFSTHDIDDKWAFQGVAKWAAHRLNKKQISRAVGFCGTDVGFSPIRGKKNIPNPFVPDGVGTDIYLAGFEGSARWDSDLIEAFAKNFFVAFNRDKLRVRIGEHELSKGNVGAVIDGLAEKDPSLKNYWDALVSKEAKEFVETFPRLGKVTVRLLVRENANKGIAMFRGTGMMIFEKRHFRTPLQFAGVCICDSGKGNEFLRRLEPPSHTAWEPERNEDDTSGAREEISSLYMWLRDCVNALSPAAASDSLDVPELEKFLPDDDEETPLDKPSGRKEGDPNAEAQLLEGRTRREKPERDQTRDEDQEETESSGEGDGEAGGEENGDGDGGTPNDSDGGDDGGGGGADAGEEPVPVQVRYRIFRRPGSEPIYVMRAEVPQKGKYSMAVSAVGDDGVADPVRPTASVQRHTDGTARALSPGPHMRVEGIEALKGGPVSVELEIPSRVPLSLTVRFFQHG
jgi:hypothetical protein